MTTRHKGYLVTLATDMREDDAAAVISALEMVKGVLSVTPIESDHLDTRLAEERVRGELGQKLLEIIYPGLGKADGR